MLMRMLNRTPNVNRIEWKREENNKTNKLKVERSQNEIHFEN